MSALADGLRRAGFGGDLVPDCPLAPLTTWKIGGPAEIVAIPRHEEDLVAALQWATAEGVPWRVLGNGSNLLVADEGVRGLVLRLRRTLDHVRRDDLLRAGAGASLPALARRACMEGLAGLEFGAGIPGTVGGAAIMNAGWHEHEFGNGVAEVRWLDGSGEPHTLGREACAFVYRDSRFRRVRGVVVEVALRLDSGDPAELRGRLDRFAASRKRDQPTELPSCGSVFLQPPGDFAGRLIEQAGLKGLQIGGARVSEKHANFFVNVGGATAADVLALVERVETEIEGRFGVRLEREFERW